jgi:hypothetical protein
MNGRLKRLVVGSVPAICGAAVLPALGETITWPQAPASKLLLDTPEPPAASTVSPEEARAARLRRAARAAEVEGLLGRPRLFRQEPMTTYGIRQ